ncbi:hypothetical protein [Dyella mobilis]|uniref:DUF1471 domain-containing protein n=1 Tax=Dyella mobilis TaxID=1849582 RepID=A0ABS2KJ01_9GAMM|nr:hypothetical protein [Dyella mobilis]MBM7130888.1 hypothetical protein [Dyella mobilis]GLQ97517.1 hypothetical protein GCM10007863_19370 [Dyella mobilis]
MKIRNVLATATLCLLCMADVQASTTSGGIITFRGGIVQMASASSPATPHNHAELAQTSQAYALRDAQRKLSSDVLDYFATYAPKNAQLISVTYR